MFSSSPNYTKLKTHLRLSINRLKLMEKKKTELTQKARREIADYLQTGKYERAKIRVEHIIREDYMVEAMEVVEMYCDLVLARFGLVTQMKELDSGLAEAVSSLLWVAPRMQSDIQELKVISDILTAKYGKMYAESCRSDTIGTVAEKLKHKMIVQTPPKLLVEKYLIEIAKIYNIDYQPDPEIMREDNRPIGMDAMLIDLSDKNYLGGNSYPPAPQAGFIGYPQPPPVPAVPSLPFNYPEMNKNPDGNISAFNYNISPNPSVPDLKETKDINTSFLQDEIGAMPPAYDSLCSDNMQDGSKPKPQPRSKLPPNNDNYPELPILPSVPSDIPIHHADSNEPKNLDDIDFDDLSRRFEELKKKK
ncbi:IST1 homolog [Ctenocephalides felis]|uniref:IST1 homolog n=1 Tax=Ctenocephalides felis TaxID=7515 RepID=UPI000E6E57FD|nr:IST1 homolog [Ctenocephalides felis]